MGFSGLLKEETSEGVLEAMLIFEQSTEEERCKLATTEVEYLTFKVMPIYIVAIYGDVDALKEIVRYANPNVIVPVIGSTPLTEMVSAQNVEKMRILLDAGADIDMPNDKGDTPAHIAAMYSFGETFRCLLDYNPDLNATTMYNGNEMTVHDMVVLNSGRDVQCLVLQHLVKMNGMTDSIVGKYFSPLIMKRDFAGICRMFSLGLYPNIDATPDAKTSAMLATYTPHTPANMSPSTLVFHFEKFRGYDVGRLIKKCDIVAINILLILGAEFSLSSENIIRDSPNAHQILLLLWSLGARFERSRFYKIHIARYRATISREMVDCLDDCERCTLQNKLEDLDTTEHFLLTAMCLPHEDIPSLYDMISLQNQKDKILHDSAELSQRIFLAQRMRNWKLVFENVK